MCCAPERSGGGCDGVRYGQQTKSLLLTTARVERESAARAERGGGLTAWTRYRAVAALLEGSGAGMPAAAQATNAADKADIWKGGILCA